MSNYKRNENNKKSEVSGIYKIKNIINGKVYIGQTYNLKYRWSRHKSDLNNNRHHNKHLQNAWNKYGEDNFRFEIIEYCPLDKIDEREIYWINTFNSIKDGYNLCDGGIGCRGYKHSEDEIEKMRMIQKPKAVVQLDMDMKFVNEWISASHASKTLGYFKLAIENCCDRVEGCKSVKGYIWLWKDDYNSGDLGEDYYLTRKNNSKRINQYDLNGEFIKSWNSVTEIVNELGYSNRAIQNCCLGRTKQSHNCIWKYV